MVNSKEISEEILLIGDKVDVVSEDGQVYRSMVEDRLDDGPFLVSVPHRRGRYMYVAQDDIIYVVFYRRGGRYIAQMKVLALEKRGAIRYMWLSQETKAQKNQRREGFRLPVTMGVVVYENDEKNPKNESDSTDTDAADSNLVVVETAVSRDISIKGIAISSKNIYTAGDEFIVGIDLENSSEITGGFVRIKKTPTLILKSIVRRCVKINESKINLVGFQFLNVTKDAGEQIARYVLVGQQRQIKNKRQLD